MLKTFAKRQPPPPALVRFQVKLVACAAVAAALPGVVLLAQSSTLSGPARALAGVALAGSVIAVVLLIHLVAPLRAVAATLRACLSESPPAAPGLKAGQAGGMVGDVTALAGRIDGMRQRLTNRHPVSLLPTREPFLAEIAEDIDRVESTVVLGVVRFADYDRLASFDQPAADRALQILAERLKKAIPRARPLAQVDRDCFAAWFRDSASLDAALGELKALGYVLGQELVDGQLKLTPVLAIGAAIFPADGVVPAELLTRAIAAAGAPAAAGGKVAMFSRQNSADARERFSLEQELRAALGSSEQFLLHYQPVVDLDAGTVIGAEALVRWRHPTLGLVPPASFIPILEQSSAMAEFGLWVLNAACREARAWREQGLGELKVAVNLSTTQCRDPRLSEMVLRTLERHGLEPSSLELELTETTAMEDADNTRRLLTDLRAHGVSVAIDDFGAGYSSLSYLKNLPFSKLKIDREFVTDVNSRQDSRAICSALVELARGLGISVLAEGVESLQEVQALHAMGCKLFQGYFFARPMDAESFVRTVQDPAWLACLGSPVNRMIDHLERKLVG